MAKRLIAFLVAIATLIYPSMAMAATQNTSIVTWGNDYQRGASVQAQSSLDPWTIPVGSSSPVSYASDPITINIPSLDETYAPDPVTGAVLKPGVFTFGQWSSTTPIFADGKMWQYTWDDGGWGHLWAYTVKASDLTPNHTFSLTGADLVQSFMCGTNSNTNFADAPSGVSISSDSAHPWMSVSAGSNLYWWPTGNPSAMLSQPILGPTDNDVCSSSPLITPNNFDMVGDFNGGFTSINLTTSIPFRSDVTHADFNVNGQPNPNDAGSSITSSPAWNPVSGTAWFGVASYADPRLISFNPATDQTFVTDKIAGGQKIYDPVWSPTPVDPVNGNVFATDMGGNAYEWNSSGTPVAKWITSQGDFNPIDNMALVRDSSGRDHISWIDMNNYLENAIAPSGTPWTESYSKSLGGSFTAQDPQFVLAKSGDYIGEGFVDPFGGFIEYSLNAVPASSTTPPEWGRIDFANFGILGSSDNYLNTIFDINLGNTSTTSNACYTWSNSAGDQKPGIVIFLMSSPSLELKVEGPYGSTPVVPSSSPPQQTYGMTGEQKSLTFYAPGLQPLNPGTYTGAFIITGFPDGSSKTIPIDLDNSVPDPLDSTQSAATNSQAAILTLPNSTSTYTLNITEKLYNNGVDTGLASPIIQIFVVPTIPKFSSTGNLTLTSFRDGNINNLGLDKAGNENMMTGEPLQARFGDTMLADLVVSVPPPPSGYQYNTAAMTAKVIYPQDVPKPTGTGTAGNNLNHYMRTVTLQPNTRAGSNNNNVSILDQVAHFPVEWPTWRPPVEKANWTWDGELESDWTVTGNYKQFVGGKHPHWNYLPFTYGGTTYSQECQIVYTEIFYMIPGSAREPWMR